MSICVRHCSMLGHLAVNKINQDPTLMKFILNFKQYMQLTMYILKVSSYTHNLNFISKK